MEIDDFLETTMDYSGTTFVKEALTATLMVLAVLAFAAFLFVISLL